MRGTLSLHLYEEVMLLALHDKKGTVFSGATWSFAIGGAVLAELLMRKRIDVEQVRAKQFARTLSHIPIGDPFMDDCLTRIAGARRRAQLREWVSMFARTKHLKQRVAEQLARRGILRVDQDKVLGIFTRRIYPEVDAIPEREVIERLQEAVFSESRAIHPRTVVLLSLAASADFLKHVFDKRELKARKARIEQVVNGELSGRATKEAIQAMQAAVMVACIMPAVAASTTSAR